MVIDELLKRDPIYTSFFSIYYFSEVIKGEKKSFCQKAHVSYTGWPLRHMSDSVLRSEKITEANFCYVFDLFSSVPFLEVCE